MLICRNETVETGTGTTSRPSHDSEKGTGFVQQTLGGGGFSATGYQLQQLDTVWGLWRGFILKGSAICGMGPILVRSIFFSTNSQPTPHNTPYNIVMT